MERVPCPPPDPNPIPPERIHPPPGSTDCHLHLFGPTDRYPLADTSRYDPGVALPDTYIRLAATLSLDRGVIVQATVQGTDHRHLLAALEEHPHKFRGVAAPAAEVSDDELAEMHAAGVRGIRIGATDAGRGGQPFDSRLVSRVSELGWHVQLRATGAAIEGWEREIRASPCPVVLDHMGLCPAGNGTRHPQFRRVLDLVADGTCWVKLSGPMWISDQDRLPYDDTIAFARALFDANPHQCVWGSDWPHVVYDGVMPNDGALLDLVADWLPDESAQYKVLVFNPAQLYGF